MPILGAHLSIAGGFHKAVDAAAALGMDTVQIFTHSPSQWAVKPVAAAPAADLIRSKASASRRDPQWVGKPLANEEIQLFRDKLAAQRLQLPMAHDSYLINLASPDETLYRRSVEAFVAEVERAEALGLAYLVMHPGTPTDGDADAGIRRIVRALDEVHRRCPKHQVMVLLETTAGQGRTLGARFEDLAAILRRVQHPDRLGVCLDTCHVFAAGYELAPKKKYDATFAEFDRIVGLAKLRAFHLNDSVKPLGSRVDRHAAIGEGCLGLEPFRRLLNDPRFRELPMVLETPKEGPNGENLDIVNLARLRSLQGGKK